jgi:hypothetical protein
MRRPASLALLALALLAGAPAAAGSARAVARVRLSPAVAQPGHRIAIIVTGVGGSSVQAQLVGATDKTGRQLPWRALVRRRGVWRGWLDAPALLGIYRVRLRTHDGGSIPSTSRPLHVLHSGTLARPTFDTPEQVVVWWLRNARRGASLVAIKRFPPPTFDLRDHRLHQLLVVAYLPRGRRAVKDRLGMFVTAYRETPTARWRLLEATVLP